MKNFFKNHVWTALGSLAAIIAVLIQFKITGTPATNSLFICTQSGAPLVGIVCIGGNQSETLFPNKAGIINVPQTWLSVSVRDQGTLNELGVIHIPSPCPPSYKAIINVKGAN